MVSELRVRGFSMFPELWPHDRLIVEAGRQYGLGDIVVIERENGPPIVHRIVAIRSQQLKTWGDSSPVPEPWVKRSSVIGVVIGVHRLGGRVPLLPSAVSAGLSAITRPFFWRYYRLKFLLKERLQAR